MSASHSETPAVDVQEHGAPRDGKPQVLDRRLFMQLLVYQCPASVRPVAARNALEDALRKSELGSVVYEDVNDPRSLGVLSLSEAPASFVDRLRPALLDERLDGLCLRHDQTMLGRTYSSGFEDNLEYWLLERPRQTVLNPKWPWAVWYPLRRSGTFEQLEPREKGQVMREHATIGKAYGAADLAHDVRLVCHGLDANDNEFVIGLVGKDLHPLSHVVQAMRRTRQTSEFIAQMGPFFVGRAVFQHAGTIR